MLRKEILEIIDHITPFDELELHHKSEIIEWIRSGAPLFRVTKPDIPPKHLVTYFVLVDFSVESVLLVDHRKACKWLPTGGHVELNENPISTVEREIKEELNIPAQYPKYFGREPLFITSTETAGITAHHTDVSLWYVLEASKTVMIEYDRSEFIDAKWFSFEEILNADILTLDPHMHRFMHKLIRKIENLQLLKS